jgi:hypothetical protein
MHNTLNSKYQSTIFVLCYIRSCTCGGEIGVEITRRMVRTCCRRMPNARQRDVQSRAESRVDWGFQYPISSSMNSHMHYKALLYSGIHCALVYAYVGRK